MTLINKNKSPAIFAEVQKEIALQCFEEVYKRNQEVSFDE